LLTPLLRQRATLRFSPDGKFLLLEDPAGIYILIRDSLKVIGHVDASTIYGARFSADSRLLHVVWLDLKVVTWSLPDLQKTGELNLPPKDGCATVQFSPNGETFACYRMDNSVDVFALATGEQLYGDVVDKDFHPVHMIPLPLNRDVPYANSIGYVIVNKIAPLVNRHLLHFPMFFSPDGSDLLVSGAAGSLFRVDLSTKKRTEVHGDLLKHSHSILARLSGDRVLVVDKDNLDSLNVFSIDTGDQVSTLPVHSSAVRLGADSRFLLWHEAGASGDHAFDLQQNRALEVPANIGMDIDAGGMAVYAESGDLFLYHMGEALPYRSMLMPMSDLSALKMVSTDASLHQFAFTVKEKGGVFEAETGKRVATLPEFIAASFADSSSGWITLRRQAKSPVQIEKWDSSKEGTSSPIPIGKEFVRSGGPVLMEYSFENPTGRSMMVMMPDGSVPYRLRALDPASGKELWKHSFPREVPIPFPDPQGDRFVLGWSAKSDEAHRIARGLTATREIYKKAKLSDKDSFFEVLDARSKKSLGGVLVQTGSGPSTFDVAFSCGDSLILFRDDRRISIYNLEDGSLRARLVGEKPVANAQSNLLALDVGAGRLALYDLRTGTKVDDQHFRDDIAYMQFSADGKRLLVLTSHQIVYVLSTEHPSLDASAKKDSGESANP
jgi:WD40 repeat protein